MKKFIGILLLMVSLSAYAAPKSSLRVVSWDISNSIGRGTIVQKGKMDVQRLWSNSVGAAAQMLADIDADLIGLQDVCDSVAGRVGDCGLIDALGAMGCDYEMVLLSNQKASFPLDGAIANATAVLYKTSRFELVDRGINWLGGCFDRPALAKGLKFGGKNRAVLWARLKEKATGKEIYLLSANINGATYYAGGKKISYPDITNANARNLIELASRYIVRPEKTPSIIMTNMHAQPSSEAYGILTGSRWLDVRDQLRDEGMLSPESDDGDQLNTPNEAKRIGGKPCHILVDRLGIESWRIWRKKYPTADGSLHYPSQVFPIVANLSF